jgi:restriction endonuclease, S subunit
MVEYAKYELKNVCSRLSSGKSISSKMISEEGRYPVYGGNGLRGYTDRSNFSGDCAIIGRQGAFCGNVRYFSGEAYMTEHAVVVCANNLNNTHYLAYLLSTMNLGRLSGQSAQPGLSVKTLGIQEIMLPSIEYQNKVVALLSSLDEKIAVNNNINDNLQQQAAAIFRSWFVDCAPFGGKAPDEWENVTLEDITALVSRGITPKYADDTDQIVINQKCIRNHTIDLSLARTHTPKIINEKWLRFGDLLINSTGDGTLGRAAQVWFQPKNLTVDSHVTIARPAKENLIFYIGLWGILHEKEIESLHTGSTGQTELPRDRVKAMELLLPDNETLDRFNGLITPMAAAIVANQEENNRLAALRDAILPKLMSGEIDVTDIQL